MDRQEDKDRIQSTRDAVQYDIFQRELDRALEGYNAVYARISMSLVVVGVLLGFVFMGPGGTGLPGAIEILAGNSLPMARWAGWFYLSGMSWYVFALCRLLYVASHRPAFFATYHRSPWFALTEHELRKREIEQCDELARYYRGATRDLLESCSMANGCIGVGVVFYVTAVILLFIVRKDST